MPLSIEEYLRSTNDPDCDFVEGGIQERNWGEPTHGRLQALLSAYFLMREKPWGVQVWMEVRVRVKPHRVRIPDILVLAADAPDEQVIAESSIASKTSSTSAPPPYGSSIRSRAAHKSTQPRQLAKSPMVF